MTETTTAVRIGDAVEYVSMRGRTKLAFVTATPETITEGTSLPALSEGQVHLFVVSPTGNTYARHNVPSAEAVADNDDFQGEDGLVGVWRARA